MNRILGFMNVLLLGAFILMLVVVDGGLQNANLVVGVVLTFVPITFTMLALEPEARFLRTAIAANAIFIVMFVQGSGVAPSNPAMLFIIPFALNIAGLTGIWIRRRGEAQEAEYESSQPEELATSYFARHWLGQQSLPVSFWVNGVIAAAVCIGMIVAASKLLENVSLRATSAAAIAFNVLLLVATVWSSVGIWRSSARHASRGGAKGWAIAAQVLVVVYAVGTTSNFFAYVLPQVKEHVLIASGRDPLGQIETQLTLDGRAAVLTGTFGAGSASKVRELLDRAPEVKTLVLDSYGGRIAEATHVARLVQERKLSTYVETHCESACTFIFLAGADRAATPHAQIGFHRASFPGMSPELDEAMTEEMLRQYRAAGLSDAFLTRVSETKAQDIWYPTHDQLVEAHVVNRVSLGGETRRGASKYENKVHLAFDYAGDPIMATINDHFHGAVDAAAAAAWELHERGASDAEMWVAARKVMLGYYEKVLRTADEPSLRAYLQIRLDQLRAARDVSEEACALVANSSLDVSQVLPRELYEREVTWLRRAIAASGRSPPPVDPQKLNEVMRRVADRVSPEVSAVVTHSAAHANEPELLCRASLEFYEAVRALPATDRSIAVRGLFQSQVE